MKSKKEIKLKAKHTGIFVRIIGEKGVHEVYSRQPDFFGAVYFLIKIKKNLLPFKAEDLVFVERI